MSWICFEKKATRPWNAKNLIRQMEQLARIRRIYGPRDLDEAAESLEDPFLRKGIELVADEYDRIDIQAVMEKEFEFHYNAMSTRVSILATLAKLATAFGFVGTIIGLINVLNHLGSPEQIGQGMALALLTTFYGLLFSNFLFLPLSKKMSEHGKMELNRLSLILEGVMDISSKKNPKAISHRLYSYVQTFHREAGAKSRGTRTRFGFGGFIKGMFNKMTARKA